VTPKVPDYCELRHSNLTEKPVYKEKVKKVRDYLDAKEKMDGGLYPNYINPDDGSWGSHSYSLGKGELHDRGDNVKN
jgi:hypothetical protein